MTKISWTCPKCQLWTSAPEESLDRAGDSPQLKCRRCEFDATPVMELAKIEHALTIHEMRLRPATDADLDACPACQAHPEEREAHRQQFGACEHTV